MFDPAKARLRAIEVRDKELQEKEPAQSVLLACELVLKYVHAPKVHSDYTQPVEGNEI